MDQISARQGMTGAETDSPPGSIPFPSRNDQGSPRERTREAQALSNPECASEVLTELARIVYDLFVEDRKAARSARFMAAEAAIS